MNQHAPAAGPLGHAAAARTAPGTALAQDAEQIAAAARDLAARFRRGGRLLTFGDGPAAADAGHVAVEFTHPVIVGKRALPALSLSADTPSTGASHTLARTSTPEQTTRTSAPGQASRTSEPERAAGAQAMETAPAFTSVFAARLRLLGRPDDIAMGILTDARHGGEVLDALATARALGMLTIALTSGEPPKGGSGLISGEPLEGGSGSGDSPGRADDLRRLSGSDGLDGMDDLVVGGGASAAADHVLVARSRDPLIAREIHVTTYHLLWELAHVFLESPEVVESPEVREDLEAPESPAAQAREGFGALESPGVLESPDGLEGAPPGCRDDVCLTCADTATPVHITELRPGGLALAATDGGTEEISVALVQAQVGDVVLVHAKEAIAVLGGESR